MIKLIKAVVNVFFVATYIIPIYLRQKIVLLKIIVSCSRLAFKVKKA
jgi:hypothetical protein